MDILQLDAHPDLYDSLDGNRLSHACPFARIMEDPGIPVQNLVQVGASQLQSACETHWPLVLYGAQAFLLMGCLSVSLSLSHSRLLCGNIPCGAMLRGAWWCRVCFAIACTARPGRHTHP